MTSCLRPRCRLLPGSPEETKHNRSKRTYDDVTTKINDTTKRIQDL